MRPPWSRHRGPRESVAPSTAPSAVIRRHSPGAPPRVIVLMGVSGSGKTTTAKRLAATLGWPYRDADEFHPPANIAKMSAGQPLNDDDRWPWLGAIAVWIDESRRQHGHGIVACSALKRRYRDMLIGAREDVGLVYLKGSFALIADRVLRRRSHFMPAALLQSQFDALEEPHSDERALIVPVQLPPKIVVERITLGLGLPVVRRVPSEGR